MFRTATVALALIMMSATPVAAQDVGEVLHAVEQVIPEIGDIFGEHGQAMRPDFIVMGKIYCEKVEMYCEPVMRTMVYLDTVNDETWDFVINIWD